MKALPITLLFALFLNSFCFSQGKSKQVLVTINNTPVTVEEFERVYQKNSQVGTTEKETVESYFDLYVKFKLKVAAAVDSGLDTLPSFINELKGYKDQLVKNYLTDTVTIKKLVKEAYDRSLTEINSSHIMITLPGNPSPKDTLVAWNKIMNIKERINKGESFEKLAFELSEDPSAKTNSGLLGYFAAFQLPYVFETGTYNTPVGTVSQPVRTRFGYHLIKVNNKRASAGEVKVAHLMIASPENQTDEQKKQSEEKINNYYNRMQNGEPFDTLAKKYSDDHSSARNNGELPWFGTRQMVPEFEDAAFELKNIGDLSKPVKTQYGWHIIKLLGKKPVQPFDKIQNDLKNKVAQNDRNEMIQKVFINRLKSEYKLVVNKKPIEKLYKLDTLIFKTDTSFALLCDTNLAFITIQKNKYTVKPFLEMIKSRRNTYTNWLAKDFIDQMITTYSNDLLVQHETNNLEKKYPEYAQLSKEYFEGILLFDIMERNVWSKASADSAGLEAYYEKNKEKYNNPESKPLDEIRGLVMSDYQNYLEENWITDLRKRYPVVVNKELLDKLSKKYNSTQNAK